MQELLQYYRDYSATSTPRKCYETTASARRRSRQEITFRHLSLHHVGEENAEKKANLLVISNLLLLCRKTDTPTERHERKRTADSAGCGRVIVPIARFGILYFY